MWRTEILNDGRSGYAFRVCCGGVEGAKAKKGDAERAHVPAFKACKAQVNKTNYSSMVARFLLRSARTASNTKEEGIT